MQLEIQNLRKNYGKKKALRGIDLTLQPGVYGILGPNGAGKSTLMNILTGNLAQTSGQILLDGVDIRALGPQYHKRLGYCPQQQSLYPSFTAEEFLYYMASLQGMPKALARQRIDWVLEAMTLADVRRKPISSFSGGMKQRLLIGQSLLHDPDILILDEPTAGLDPRQRINVRNLIGQIAKEKIVLISTHVVQDVEHVARELILLSGGRIVCNSTAWELQNQLDGQIWMIPMEDIPYEQIQTMGTVCGIVQEPDGVYARILRDVPPEIGKPAWPNLEDVYLKYFGITEGL